jgi:predicted metal-binding membrane protein
MPTMPMLAGGTASMAWMPMCGQSWIAAAASFLVMWTLMMAAMMLPSWVPMLWRYRQSVGRAGEWPRAGPAVLVAAGYLLVWALVGAAVYPLGYGTVAAAMRWPALARAMPIATGLVMVIAGALQFSRWKARHLACCRGCQSSGPLADGRASPAGPLAALRHGLRLGLHCTQCCAGLTAVLLVSGLMDAPVMLAVTAGITLERLAPAGERCARAVGVVVVGAGVLLIVRAAARV